MAQPTQVFAVGSYEYCVIDNGPAGNSIASASAGPAQGNKSFDETTGAVAQGKNAFDNGNIPDAVASATTEINDGTTGIYIRFKNPA